MWMCCAKKISEIKQKHIFYPLTIFIARNEQEKFLFHIYRKTPINQGIFQESGGNYTCNGLVFECALNCNILVETLENQIRANKTSQCTSEKKNPFNCWTTS